ncbi:hypothetical protein J8631_00310 [Serratia fonticola]|uniref:Uncharacterized protein n=1 Tax=Serratia fonticola TaxID=47917 RepID=A0AAE7JT82_SERFO|nr:hypothetical protein [Serratia fonticola]MBP1033995.1 hypothetical protein [Serratia fonticola]MCO7512677.1 hypothetical protein [Serratia fonticola]QKJ58763.1 hypothetical protein G9399_10805 [Serratia fonticola]
MKTFNSEVARQAQAKYCKEKQYPHFAPLDGICYRCKRDIYQQQTASARPTGISVQEAGSKLICFCPHCNRSYDD